MKIRISAAIINISEGCIFYCSGSITFIKLWCRYREEPALRLSKIRMCCLHNQVGPGCLIYRCMSGFTIRF